MPGQRKNTMSTCHKRFFLTIAAVLALLISLAALHAKPTVKSNPYYDVKVTTQTQEKRTLATITVTGKSGYHCNTLYAWKLRLEPEPGIALQKKVLRKRDAKKFSKEAVIFEVPYNRGPNQKISATLKFSVCNEKQCLIEKIPLSW